jgi:UDP-N-acetylmuramoyl-L-alanyl-D-glutamate--2,6-diaminopimelate ligase
LLPRSTKERRLAIVNGDDPYGQRLTTGGGAELWTYGSSSKADLSFQLLEQGFGGVRFRLRTPRGEGDIRLRMTGLHNVYNATGAIGAALHAGVSLETCASALADLGGVPGRLEAIVNTRGIHVFVDYAHSDDALRTVLYYLGEIRKNAGLTNRIITVFGCGGDRDKGKRPLMMKAALAGSDVVVVTSDNPRTEDPELIIKDALAGAEPAMIGTKVFKEVDRRRGIKLALKLASQGDVVLIAGKGHEDYQQIGTVKYPFSDAAVVKEILA